jgi:hypothetical protein
MAKIIFDDIQEFFDFVPLLVMTALKNDELLNDPASDFFDDISKKLIPVVRQYFLQSDPDLRRKLKFFLKGLGSNQMTTISILPDKKSNEFREQKYLTESWQPVIEKAKKYLRSQNV